MGLGCRLGGDGSQMIIINHGQVIGLNIVLCLGGSVVGSY